VPAAVANCITEADQLINGQVVPPVGEGHLAPSQTSALVQCLDGYNNGRAENGPPHCQ
jgi:hypothetical protein